MLRASRMMQPRVAGRRPPGGCEPGQRRPAEAHAGVLEEAAAGEGRGRDAGAAGIAGQAGVAVAVTPHG